MSGLFGVAARPYWLLWGGALLFRLLTALLFSQPGYTDAYYYSNVAESLWRGRGFREDYLWNYLSQPLPTSFQNNPSSTYWMPLTSVLIYFSYTLTGGPSFLASQLPNILLSSTFAPLAYYLALDIFGKADPRATRYGWLAGVLMIFCGLYAPYFSLPDNFAPFALFSSGFLICTYKALRLSPAARRSATLWLALAGLCAGLAYLTRVDGLLLLAVPFFSWLLHSWWLRRASGLSWAGLGLMLGVFVVTIAPWLAHNALATGQIFPGGGTKTLFWREYNDFFSYQKSLDLAYYLNLSQPSADWGIGPLVLSKLQALLENLWLWGRGALLLFPLFIIGLLSREQAASVQSSPQQEGPAMPPAKGVRLWQRAEFVPFVVYSVLLYLAMSLAFTFPSTRGSVFHSSGGLLPFIYLLGLVGLDGFIRWLGRLSRPKAELSRRRSYSIIVVLAFAMISVGFAFTLRSNWDTDYRDNRAVGQWLAANDPGALVMVADAPAYQYATGQPSLAITSDPLPVNLELARRYNARYFMLQPNHAPASLTDLFYNKTAPGYRLVATLGEIQLYHLEL